MTITKNESGLDRLARVILSELLLIGGFFWLGGVWQIIVYVLAGIMLVTAVDGFCLIYKLLGLSTNKDKPTSKIVWVIFAVLFLVVGLAGSYYSNFFTKKFFLDDYTNMNNFYKQTLFNTGQDKRAESIENYDKLVTEYAIFSAKYSVYHPYVFKGDKQLNNDLEKVSIIITGLKNQVYSGDLKQSHLAFEAVRPILQDILKRNGFSMLAVVLVDFHDAMEKIIASADAKNSQGILDVYGEVSDKLKAVEEITNDNEIQTIRKKLEEVLTLAKEGKDDELSAKAGELKSSFVKVYLKRG